MRIDQVTVAADATVNNGRDSVQIQAQNREVIQAVRFVGDHANLGDSNELTFFLDRKTRQPIIKIVNRVTGEVVQQIPNEQILRMADDMKLSADARR